MKKLIALAIALAVTAAAVPAEAGPGIKVKGGFTWIGYGDFNTWVDETNKEIPSGISTFDNMNWIPEISAEFTFPLLPTFSGAVGVGYLSGKWDYNFSIGADGLSYVHKVKSVPVLLNVYWEPPLVFINPFIYGGVGFYRTSLEFDYSETVGGNTDGYNAEMDKWGFGLQAGGGIRLSLIPLMSLDVGVQGRWADVSGFEGTATNQDGETKEVYLGKGVVNGYHVYGPEERDSELEEASVDLSGFTIFVGLTFSF